MTMVPEGVFTFQVTQEHIDEGEREDGRGCAVALALMDRAGVISCEVADESQGWLVTRGGRVTALKFASDTSVFIEEFDMGNPVAPATLTARAFPPTPV